MRNARVKIPVKAKPDGNGLQVLDTTLYHARVAALQPGRTYAMVITEWREKTISDPMRRYYFGVVAQMIADHTGHSTDTIHDFLKRKILGVNVDQFGIEQTPSVFSDGSSLTIEEKGEFIAEVRRWASDFLGIWIPEPERVVA